MGEVTTVGLEIAKSVFQVHGIEAEGAVLVKRKLPRSRLLSFFRSCRGVWSGSRPARQPITGRGSFGR